MRPFAALLVVSLLMALLLASPAPAQPSGAPAPQTVVLGGWGLPEGAAVTTSTRALRTARVHTLAAEAGDEDAPLRTLEVYSAYADSLRLTVLEADAEGLRRGEEHVLVSDVLEDVFEDDEPVQGGTRTSPLSGLRLSVARAGEGWTRALLGGEPSAAQAEAMAALPPPGGWPYPTHPVAVGATWEVDRAALEARYGALAADAPQRKTYRLDSLGVFLGRPAAFLSFGLDLTIEENGSRTRLHEVGAVVRALDLYLDLYAERHGTFRTEEVGPPRTDAEGRAVRSVMEGRLRTREERFVTLPRAPEP